MSAQGGAGISTAAPVVFLVDVDDTLLDNDRTLLVVNEPSERTRR